MTILLLEAVHCRPSAWTNSYAAVPPTQQSSQLPPRQPSPAYATYPYQAGAQAQPGSNPYNAAYTPTYPQPQYTHGLSPGHLPSAHTTPPSSTPGTTADAPVPADFLSQLISAGLIPAGKDPTERSADAGPASVAPVVMPRVFNLGKYKVFPSLILFLADCTCHLCWPKMLLPRQPKAFILLAFCEHPSVLGTCHSFDVCGASEGTGTVVLNVCHHPPPKVCDCHDGTAYVRKDAHERSKRSKDCTALLRVSMQDLVHCKAALLGGIPNLSPSIRPVSSILPSPLNALMSYTDNAAKAISGQSVKGAF